MVAVTSADGPVAVTGAAGYIGAHVCLNLVQHGYTVRACVRDKSRADKTDHLLAMNVPDAAGQLELHEADMLDKGSYDEIFAGCSCIFHIAADLGHDVGGLTKAAGQPVGLGGIDLYNSIVDSTRNVLDSIEQSGSVTRLVYTSSGAAIKGPHPKGHVFTEEDWCGAGGLPKKFGKSHTNEKNPYGKGQYNYPQRWGITDVRDCADGYRRIAESHTVQTGDRFFTITTEEAGGYPTPYELVDMLKQIYPEEEGIGGDMLDQRGNFIPPEMDDWLLVGSTKAQDELALRCHTGTDTLRDTIESLRKFGCLDEIHAQMVVAAQLQEAPKL